MNTTELINPLAAPSVGQMRSANPDARPLGSDSPTVVDLLLEAVPLISVVPVAGPPAILLAGPLVLLALMLAGPFLLLVTFALAAMCFVVVAAAIVSPIYVLVRGLRNYGTRGCTAPRGRTPPHPHTSSGEAAALNVAA